jgi:hypothetical protein
MRRFMVVLVVFGVALAARPAVASDGRASAEEVARGFLDAYGAFDADRAMTFVTKHALAAEWGTPADFRLELKLLEATGWRQTIRDQTKPAPPPGRDGCEVYDFAAHQTKDARPRRLTVRCHYEYHGLRSDEVGRAPYGDHYWNIVVHKGRIVSVEDRGPSTPDMFDVVVWKPFRRWVRSAYPKDAAAMYQGTKRFEWKRTLESVRLWDQHSREYVAAGVPYIDRAHAICAAAHDRLAVEFGPSPGESGETSPASWQTYFIAAADILDETLAELRAVPPPEPFREEFEYSYSVGDQVVRQLRGEGDGDQGAIHWFGGTPGLHACTFELPR